MTAFPRLIGKRRTWPALARSMAGVDGTMGTDVSCRNSIYSKVEIKLSTAEVAGVDRPDFLF